MKKISHTSHSPIYPAPLTATLVLAAILTVGPYDAEASFFGATSGRGPTITPSGGIPTDFGDGLLGNSPASSPATGATLFTSGGGFFGTGTNNPLGNTTASYWSGGSIPVTPPSTPPGYGDQLFGNPPDPSEAHGGLVFGTGSTTVVPTGSGTGSSNNNSLPGSNVPSWYGNQLFGNPPDPAEARGGLIFGNGRSGSVPAPTTNTPNGNGSVGTGGTIFGNRSGSVAAVPANTDTVQINAGDNFFSPNTISVRVGTIIAWTNRGATSHSVVSDGGYFDSGTIAPGQTYAVRFTTPGQYFYHDRAYGVGGGIGMAGVITVIAGSGSNSTGNTGNNGGSGGTGGLVFGNRGTGGSVPATNTGNTGTSGNNNGPSTTVGGIFGGYTGATPTYTPPAGSIWGQGGMTTGGLLFGGNGGVQQATSTTGQTGMVYIQGRDYINKDTINHLIDTGEIYSYINDLTPAELQRLFDLGIINVNITVNRARINQLLDAGIIISI